MDGEQCKINQIYMIQQIYLQLDAVGFKFRKKRNLEMLTVDELTHHIRRLKRIAAKEGIYINWVQIHQHRAKITKKI